MARLDTNIDVKKEYAAKLRTPEQAAAVVKSGDWVDFGHGSIHAELCDKALSARTEELFDIKLRAQWIIDHCYCVDADPEGEHFAYSSFYFSAYERKLFDRGLCFHQPMQFRDLYRYYSESLTTNVLFVAATPMDEEGWFNMSLAGGVGRTFTENADFVVVEVNEHLPWVSDERKCSVHISEVDMVVEGEHGSLPEVASKPPSENAKRIARYIMPHIKDGASIQIGIGGVPDALASIVADSDIKDLGMHTEFCTNGYMDLYKAGKITNRKKNIDKGIGLYATSAGTHEFHEWIDRNPGVGVRPVGYMNDPYVIGQLDDFISINGCLSVDIYGQVSSESVGLRHISGSGGQVDYALGAIRSKGGKGFICLNSTRTGRDGKVHSNIVPHFNGEIITTPRTHTMFIVTEHGAVNIFGKSNWERAEMLISVADPAFREDLIKAAEEQHVWRRSNRR